MDQNSFFTEYGEANRFTIHEVIGKGSYGVVCSATDNKTGEKVAIKKITDVFEHVSDATRILREVKLLRVLKHPDIVEVKHIVLPPNPRDFKDIFVIFELMETDLHQVIKANDDLTPEHHQFFLYQVRPARSGDSSSPSYRANNAGRPSRVPSGFHPRPPRRFESRRCRSSPDATLTRFASPVLSLFAIIFAAAPRLEIRAHGQRVPSRSQAEEHPRERRL